MNAVHVGIVACSAEGAALCYRTLCAEAEERFGTHHHPEVTMHTHSLGRYLRALEREGWDGVARLMLDSAARLAAAGATLLVCPDNTIHQAFPAVESSSPLPWLHIAREVGREAARRGFRRLGVLGTRLLMEGPVYRDALAEAGIGFQVPGVEDRRTVDGTIFQDLVRGRFPDAARAAFAGIIQRLADGGCDAVVLGCTEIPLLVGEADSTLPTLDSTRILARAALREAAGRDEPPDSFGGGAP